MRRLNDILLQRGMLLERIATQRYFIAAEIRPVRTALDRVDLIRAQIRMAVEHVKRSPLLAGVAVATLVALNFRRTFRLARRGFVIWKTWQTLRQRIMFF